MINRIAAPEVLLLVTCKSLVVPVPPTRPSMIQYLPAFISIVATALGVTVAFEITLPVTPVASRIVMVLTALAPEIDGNTTG